MCVAACLLLSYPFPKDREEEMTTQTEESERWLHFNRKTNREGVSAAVGVTVTGETETQRGKDRDIEPGMKRGGY